MYLYLLQAKAKLLSYKAVAYLNLDVVVVGNKTISAFASPLLHRLIEESAQKVNNAGARRSFRNSIIYFDMCRIFNIFCVYFICKL